MSVPRDLREDDHESGDGNCEVDRTAEVETTGDTKANAHHETDGRRLHESAELLLDEVRAPVNLGESGNLLDDGVNGHADGCEYDGVTMRNGNADQAIGFLDCRLRDIGELQAHDLGDDESRDRKRKAARQSHDEAGGERPDEVIEDVDVERIRKLGENHDEVHRKTDGQQDGIEVHGERYRSLHGTDAQVEHIQIEAEVGNHRRKHWCDRAREHVGHGVDTDHAATNIDGGLECLKRLETANDNRYQEDADCNHDGRGQGTIPVDCAHEQIHTHTPPITRIDPASSLHQRGIFKNSPYVCRKKCGNLE